MRRCLPWLLLAACAGAPAPAAQRPVPEAILEIPPPPAVPKLSVFVHQLDQLPAVIADGPPITELTISFFPEYCESLGDLFERLAASRRLAHVESLDIDLPYCFPLESLADLAALDLPALSHFSLTAHLGDRGATILADLPLLAPVTHLDLSGSPIDHAGLIALAHSPQLRRLHHLELRESLRTANAGLALAETPAWTGLRRLDLSENVLDRAALAALGGNPALANVEALDISAGRHDDRDRFAAFIRAGGLPNLTSLSIGGSEDDDAGLTALAETRRWPDLRMLTVSPGSIGPDGGAALARATHLAALEHLKIRYAGLGPEGSRALAGASHLAGLRTLDLYHSALDGEAAAALIALLADPERLSLSYNLLGDAAAIAVAARRDWTRMRSLDLAHTGLSDAGAVALAAAPQLAGLEQLTLHDNMISERGWRALLASPTLAHLADESWQRELALQDTTISPEDAARQVPRDLEIELSRRGCMVLCPRYSVILHADGRVVYRGVEAVAVVGPAESRIDQARVQLANAALEAFLATEPGRHPSRSARCTARVSDQASVVIRVRRNGRTRTFTNSTLCPSSAAWTAFYPLGERLDALLDTARWTYAILPLD
jgi:hypothetical protein